MTDHRINPIMQAVVACIIAVPAFVLVQAAHRGDWIAWLSDLLAEDATYIIRMQLAGAIVLLVLLALQLVLLISDARHEGAGLATLRSSLGGPQSPVPATLDLERRELAFAQHADAILSVPRILVAAFPTSGFIGTVIGIRQAIAPLDDLAGAGGDPGVITDALPQVVGGLEVAFDTTLVGLVMLLFGSVLVTLFAAAVRRSHVRELTQG